MDQSYYIYFPDYKRVICELNAEQVLSRITISKGAVETTALEATVFLHITLKERCLSEIITQCLKDISIVCFDTRTLLSDL